MGYSPVKITTAGINGYSFGGSLKSIDHKTGNQGQFWYVIQSKSMDVVHTLIKKTASLLFFIGLGLSVILALVALFMGRKIAAPVKRLGDLTVEIASGRFDKRIHTTAKDEFGNLALSFNHMLDKLQQTTASRQALELEIAERKRAEIERDNLIKKLRKALDEVKTLSGLFPICSYCKKIRDDKGYWNQIETYIRDHSEAEFSHSICEECAKKYYPELDIYDD